MHGYKKLWAGALLGVVSTSLALAKPAQEFSGVYSFGDDFSSTANSWADNLTQRYGFVFTAGTNNFGANDAGSPQLAGQLAAYNLAITAKQPDALYTVYTGASDFVGPNGVLANGYAVGLLADVIPGVAANPGMPGVAGPLAGGGGLAGLEATYNAGTLVYSAATFPNTHPRVAVHGTEIGTFVNGLQQAGANAIVVFNHFNEFKRQQDPAVDAALVGATAAQLNIAGEVSSKLYNDALFAGIEANAASANVIYIDYKRLVDEVHTNGNSYFTAAEMAAASPQFHFFRLAAGLLLADVPHAAAQKLTSQYVASVVEAPTKVALVREIPLNLGTAIAQRTRSLASTFFLSEGKSKWTVDAVGNFENSRTGSFTKKELGFTNAKTFSGEVFANYRLKPHALLGLRVSHAQTKLDFVAKQGHAKVQETALSFHGAYKFETPFFVYGSAGVGMLSYRIERDVALGIATRTHKGTPRGVHAFGSVGTGYRLVLNKKYDLALTPFVSGSYQSVSMKRYTEDGDLQSTTMSFDIAKRESILAELGATLEATFKARSNLSILPSIGFSYSYDFKEPIKDKIKGKVSDMPRYFSMPGYKVDASAFHIHGQVVALTSNGLSLGLQAGVKPNGRVKTWNLGLNVGIKL